MGATSAVPSRGSLGSDCLCAPTMHPPAITCTYSTGYGCIAGQPNMHQNTPCHTYTHCMGAGKALGLHICSGHTCVTTRLDATEYVTNYAQYHAEFTVVSSVRQEMTQQNLLSIYRLHSAKGYLFCGIQGIYRRLRLRQLC